MEVAVRHHQPKFGELPCLGCFGFQVGVSWIVRQDLLDRQRDHFREILVAVCLVEVAQLLVQGTHAEAPVPVPILVVYLEVEETPQGVLEAAQVGCVHGVDRQIIHGGSRGSQDRRRRETFQRACGDILLVGDSCRTVGRLWGEVVKAVLAWCFGGLAHPTESVRIDTPDPETLLQPFPVSSDLHQGRMRDDLVAGNASQGIVRRPP